jgi:hypothetical protein
MIGFLAARLEILQFLEIGEHIVIAPPLVAELTPTVIVGGCAAIIDHAVNRG